MNPVTTIACFGGVYNNYLALGSLCEDAAARGATQLYCLGDMGAFGPYPDRVFPILRDNDISCLRGNYDDSVARGLDDCQCGYTDPQDNYFARLSYAYTFENTSEENRRFLGSLPESRTFEINGVRILLCHGSPRQVNEFLWESTTPTHLLEGFCDAHQADVILCTHTGLHWKRELSGGRLFANVGVIGRPANDGRTNVWYSLLRVSSTGVIEIEFIPLSYDHKRLAAEMRAESIPEEFVESIVGGWWTTCLEILPGKERASGRY